MYVEMQHTLNAKEGTKRKTILKCMYEMKSAGLHYSQLHSESAHSFLSESFGICLPAWVFSGRRPHSTRRRVQLAPCFSISVSDS